MYYDHSYFYTQISVEEYQKRVLYVPSIPARDYAALQQTDGHRATSVFHCIMNCLFYTRSVGWVGGWIDLLGKNSE